MAKRRRHLSAEEKALWSSVAASATPLHKRTPKQEDARPDEAPKPERRTKPKADIPKFQIGQTATPNSIAKPPAPKPSVVMDKNTFRKLSKGRMKPEARIDLHGMTLAQAHPALNRFVLSSHAAGHRLILVITGKGRTGKDTGGPVPERKGVLRDQVPHWLASGPCKSAVLQISQAHATHGGGGAYYVYLRRTR